MNAADSQIRTLLWIGPRHGDSIRPAFDLCESTCEQIAFRSSLEKAMLRVASSVDRIVFSRTNRATFDWNGAIKIATEHPAASVACLLGELCEGAIHNERFAIADANRELEMQTGSQCLFAKWHQSSSVLPKWLAAKPTILAQRVTRPTVAVVATNLASAEPILDGLAGCGTPTMWVRKPNAYQLRNVGRVIWDDSFATATTAKKWHNRISAMDLLPGASHAWMVNCPQTHQIAAARQGGIERIVSKPSPIEAIEQWVSIEKQSEASVPAKMAA
ncbi:hypothetical protein CA13_15200 [Planctomycetes bacterium CA13]|uniref:Uncharacterized protein n=1 Tax=Novipirellula herctigrandis TaxID=2527986 RepID=A0A5C5YZV3_9BACT|nr:hypothetical protein CA13_15200 [Planctomycetes bacterium CA13]